MGRDCPAKGPGERLTRFGVAAMLRRPRTGWLFEVRPDRLAASPAHEIETPGLRR
jgi:hypothetical protein